VIVIVIESWFPFLFLCPARCPRPRPHPPSPSGPMILTAIADRLGLANVHTTAAWTVLRKVSADKAQPQRRSQLNFNSNARRSAVATAARRRPPLIWPASDQQALTESIRSLPLVLTVCRVSLPVASDFFRPPSLSLLPLSTAT